LHDLLEPSLSISGLNFIRVQIALLHIIQVIAQLRLGDQLGLCNLDDGIGRSIGVGGLPLQQIRCCERIGPGIHHGPIHIEAELLFESLDQLLEKSLVGEINRLLEHQHVGYVMIGRGLDGSPHVSTRRGIQ